jgi:chromosomal replication initiator protein
MPLDPSTPDVLWTAVADRIRDDLSPMVFGAWFSTTRALTLDGDVLEVGVPNEFTRSWIEGHFSELVRKAARSPGRLGALPRRDGEADRCACRGRRRRRAHGCAADERQGARAGAAEPLRSKYTFGSFVIGSSTASRTPQPWPSQKLPAGLQPARHLRRHRARKDAPAAGDRALRADARAGHAGALRHLRGLHERVHRRDQDKRMDAFKRRYREEFDVLLIDDIHFLAGKDGIQEEFFHTFNTLHASGRQLVLSSDRAPREISDLADRLRSRFEWGLLVDVQPPDIETRIAILRKRVAADRVRIDDPELLPAIARRVPTNIRELEGALTRVLAYASLTGRPASAALVRETLRDLPDADRPVSVATIKQVVSDAFAIPVTELESAKRSQVVVAPRQLAMYLCRELTDATLPAIGREFGGRDHTTVLYAVQKISRRLHHDRREYDQVDDLIRRIKRHA